MKSIKRVQTDSTLLFSYNHENKQVYTGYMFDREELDNLKKSSILKYRYNVYIPELKIVTTIKASEYIHNYSSRQMTIHLFNEEAYLKQKIRLQLV
jgi:hypothetical protein